MIDEDMAVERLEALANRIAAPAAVVGDAVFVRRDDRVLAVGLPDPAAALPALAAGGIPDDAKWWLSLTRWGRLEMWGDIAAAAAWVDTAAD